MFSVLIIGCGNIAGGFDANRPESEFPFTHAGAYTRHGGFTLVGCVEPVESKRSAFMHRWSIAQGYASVQEAIASGLKVDVVSVCSPTGQHYQDVLGALEMTPRLIFCEKPVTPSATQTEKLLARCAAAGVLLAVNYTRRWDAVLVQKARELQAGKWGVIRAVSAVYNKGVLNNGSHMIDLLQLVFGPLILEHVGRQVPDAWVDDPSVPCVLSGPAGLPIQINCAHAADYSLFQLQVVTEHGVLTMEDGGLNWHIRPVVSSGNFAGYKTLAEGERENGGLQQATFNAIVELHSALLHGSGLSSSGENALASQLLCEKIHRLSKI